MTLPGTHRLKGYARSALHELRHRATLRKLRREASGRQPRILAIAGWNFPVYSQTFVYQELTQLSRAGFDLRMAYSGGGEKWELDPAFTALDVHKIWLASAAATARREIAYFRRRQPQGVTAVLRDLHRETGLSEGELEAHRDVGRGFIFARLAEALGANYLHSYFFYEGSLACFVASRLLRLPRGVSCYADHQLRDYPLKIQRLQLTEAALVVATSHRIAREVHTLAPNLDEDHLLIKPNAIDTGRFPVVDRDDKADGPLRLLSVCRLEPKKGLTTLLTAVAELRRRGVAVELRQAGGSDRNHPGHLRELERLGEDLALGGALRFLGPLPTREVVSELHRAQVFVAPYEATAGGDKDGVPTSLMEAMSSGLPVVAADSGSIAELVTDGRDGLLVPAGDPSALADAVTRLAASPEERERLATEAAATVRQRFDVKVCEPALHQRIRHLLRREG
ncbi:MAG: glycosyltransferase [Acidobacteriota bacterium]